MKEITFVFDYICPYCYLMLPEVKRLQEEQPIKIKWIPMEIHPETPLEGINLKTFFGSQRIYKIQKKIEAEANRKKMVFYLPDRLYHTGLANLVTAYAMGKLPMEEVVDAFYRRVFVYNENIGDLEVLRKLCIQLGLSFESFLQQRNEKRIKSTMDQWNTFVEHHQILGVPALLEDGNILASGVCSYREVERMISK